ncbi:Mll1468 protein [hydrothermal vent metagenome]|uniref:Mll1468 protein n=1 Tax=hydrothermal vent metagenome TaxID=652676 RepID=A0A1W1BDK5_9ZZZZ
MAIVITITKIFKKILTIGTPPDDDVLYSKVVKRKIPDKSAEALVVEDFKNAIQSVKSKFVNTDSPDKEEKTTSAETESNPTASIAKSSSAKTVSNTKKNTTKSREKKVEKKTTVKKKKPVTTKKTAIRESTPTKKTATDTTKKKSTQKGSKRAEKIALYIKDIKKHYGEADKDFVTIIVKNLGPSIYRKDAELVSCSDPKELDTVRRNFLVKKLGLKLSKKDLDTAIQEVCLELKSTRKKYRATFYYRLAQKFKKESVLS